MSCKNILFHHRGFRLKIQTFSIVVGTSACDGDCPFCVSHTTGFDELPSSSDINVRNFRKAARLAQLAGTTTVLFTGKGEPTLYPLEIFKYLNHLRSFDFPFIELQTNAMRIGYLAEGRKGAIDRTWLTKWYDAGLNTIAISVVGIDQEHNSQIYKQDYPNLVRTIDLLHTVGYSIRLCVMMQKGMVDSPEKLQGVINFCAKNGVEQLTARPIRRPQFVVLEGDKYGKYIDHNGLTEKQIGAIHRYIETHGTHLSTLMNGGHAARIYDVDGQNLCLSDCLTVEPSGDDIRTLIFYPGGRITYDWQYPGARLL